MQVFSEDKIKQYVKKEG